MYNYNDDSDEEFNYDLSGNHAAGNNHTQANLIDSESKPVVNDFIYEDTNVKLPNENDLKIEDDWNFETPDSSQQPQQKHKSKRQELLDAQKNKLKKKTYKGDGQENPGYTNAMNKKKKNAPTLDDMYNNEYESKYKQVDQELDGEIQHESLKKKLEEQRHNQRVEFVAQDPAMLLKQKNTQQFENEPQSYGSYANQSEGFNNAQAEFGSYNDDQKQAKKKKKKKRRTDAQKDENGIDPHESEGMPIGQASDSSEHMEGHYLQEQERIPASHQRDDETAGSTNWDGADQPPHDDAEDAKPKKKKTKKKKRTDDEVEQINPKQGFDQTEEAGFAEGEDHDPSQEEAKVQRKKSKKEKKDKNKRRDEILRIKNEFMEKLISPFTEVDELIGMFMRPLPKEVGILECTISRNKSGFNFWNPKYTLVLSEGERFLLNGKKRGGNKTSNYLITLDQDNLKKKGKGFLGKLRANFMGTEFVVYDQGENPNKTKAESEIRREMASVLYESNVLGSKGPRKMRVMIPAIDKEDNICTWKPVKKEETMIEKYKGGQKDMMLVFHNKEPKWNETVQAYVLNFNGRVDQASVKNFQLIMSDENYIFMQFGKVGKNDFNMDVQWPISIFQAFAISLSSIDKKFGCE